MENAFDGIDEVLKACEGISVDIPDVKEEDIGFYDNIITLPYPLSAVNKNDSEILPVYPLSAIVDIEKSIIQC